MRMELIRCFGFLLLSFFLASLVLQWRRRSFWRQPDQSRYPSAHQKTTTIIVGAGVVGLCTAYHLAKSIDKKRHKVVVIEAAGQVFAATSSTNTGILSYTGFQEELLPLAQYSYDLWEDLGRDTDFRTSCGYKENANFALKIGSGKGAGESIPNWIHTRPE